MEQKKERLDHQEIARRLKADYWIDRNDVRHDMHHLDVTLTARDVSAIDRELPYTVFGTREQFLRLGALPFFRECWFYRSNGWKIYSSGVCLQIERSPISELSDTDPALVEKRTIVFDEEEYALIQRLPNESAARTYSGLFREARFAYTWALRLTRELHGKTEARIAKRVSSSIVLPGVRALESPK